VQGDTLPGALAEFKSQPGLPDELLDPIIDAADDCGGAAD
jgi:hypothetical protein